MNHKLIEFKENIKAKNVAILGIGISNRPLLEYLSSMGAKLTAFDVSDSSRIDHETLEFIQQNNIETSFGPDYLKKLKGFDIIFKTPKIRSDIPELLSEKARGAIITSEMEVFLQLCPAYVFAITGSDGKTTTATLIYKILSEQGHLCWLGGNIGNPLLSKVEQINDSHLVVLELSSFQLQNMICSPQTSVITNLSPNHLDVHLSMKEYINAKKSIFHNQMNPEDRLILNFDNEITTDMAREAKGKVLFFSRLNKEIPLPGAYVNEGFLCFNDGKKEFRIVHQKNIFIPGSHNIENYLAAICAVWGRGDPECISSVATTFTGVEHRIELVREYKGVRYFNDSIATSPARTIAGLNSFNQKVILIAGGKDKNLDYTDLGPVLAEKVKFMVLTGETSTKILDSWKKASPNITTEDYIISSSLEEACVNASSYARPGDVVIMSPASTSFDMFRNFEKKGQRYKEIIMSL